jgi:hypothetical protein
MAMPTTMMSLMSDDNEDDNDGSDEDFLRDLELYKQQEESIAEDARQLENDLQMATTSMA